MGVLRKLLNRVTNTEDVQRQQTQSSMPAFARDADGQIKVGQEAIARTMETLDKMREMGYEMLPDPYGWVAAAYIIGIAQYYDFDLENEAVQYSFNSMILVALAYFKESKSIETDFDLEKVSLMTDMMNELVTQVPKENRRFFISVYMISEMILHFGVESNEGFSIPKKVLMMVLDQFKIFIRDTLGCAGFPDSDPMAASEESEEEDYDALGLDLYRRGVDAIKYFMKLCGTNGRMKATCPATMMGFYCACVMTYFQFGDDFLMPRLNEINKYLVKLDSPALTREKCHEIADLISSDHRSKNEYIDTAAEVFADLASQENNNPAIANSRLKIVEFGKVSVTNLIDFIDGVINEIKQEFRK